MIEQAAESLFSFLDEYYVPFSISAAAGTIAMLFYSAVHSWVDARKEINKVKAQSSVSADQVYLESRVRSYLSSGKQREAEVLIAAQAKILSDRLEGYSPQELEAMWRLATAASSLQMSDEAMKFLDILLRSASMDVPELLSKRVKYLELAGTVRRRVGDYQSAKRYFEEALAIDLDDRLEVRARLLSGLATLLADMGLVLEAEKLQRQSIEALRKISSTGGPEYVYSLNNLAAAIQSQGRYAEAEALYREALAIARSTIGVVHPAYAMGLNNLAGVVEAQGHAFEAEALFREALEIARNVLGEWHPDYATHLNNLALVLKVQGRTDEARTLFEQTLAILEATLSADHPRIASVRQALASLP